MSKKTNKKTAVIVFNLGGPDELKSVKPFLFNLFNDPAIINLPNTPRFLLAKIISTLRAKKARGIYAQMGGKSPILNLTGLQAEALEKQLKRNAKDGQDFRVFVSMRYWHPMSDMVIKNVENYNPDHLILLPLYPQYSTTTTGSSFEDWERAAANVGFSVPTTKICCYPTDLGFIAAHAKLIKDAYWKAAETGKPRVLFSAHGLPEKIVKAGDPYQSQVEKTVAALTQVLAIEGLDYTICYQSRVGLMKWIGPSTEAEIHRAGSQGLPLLVVPIAFVSEHSETLVKLDIEYRELAEHCGVTGYVRVPALGIEPMFIESLADLCLTAVEGKTIICPFDDDQCIANIREPMKAKAA